MTVYAAIADVRARGITSQDKPDQAVTAAITLASALVDAYVGHGYRTPAEDTLVVADVRGANVFIDEPFFDITEVTVNDYLVNEASYVPQPWGISFHSPPRLDRFGRGVTVGITATFGQDTPLLVKEATIELALVRLQGTTSLAATLPGPKDGVASFSEEGLSISYVTGAAGQSLRTTGSSVADGYLNLLPKRSGIV